MAETREAAVEQVLAEALARLGGDGAARLDAQLLLAHVLGWERTRLLAHPGAPVPLARRARMSALVAERARGVPLAYLTGRREFWSLALQVGPGALIPRPETELLVECALARLEPGPVVNVLELGTGCGAVALAVARERPACPVVAVERGPAALSFARRNAVRLGIAGVRFLAGDWYAPVAGMRFGLILANPPYVREDDPALARGDLRFEPREALAGGPDGLASLRRIVEGAPAHLHAGGALLLEHGHDQGAAVRALLERAGFTGIATHRDLAGRERVTGAAHAGS